MARRSRHLFVAAAATAAIALSAPRAEAAVTANVVGNTLTITGDEAGNGILVSVLIGDPTRIEVRDGATVVGTFLRATFNAITVNGGDGADSIMLTDDTGNLTEPATVFGGPGNDHIYSANTADTLNGGEGDDVINWSPGQGSDIVDGGPGRDQLTFNGSNATEVMTIAPNGARVRLTRDIGSITMDIGTIEQILVEALGGNDTVTAANGLVANGLQRLFLNGGDGADTLTGADTIDVINGGLIGDTLNGGDADDQLLGGEGNDELNGGGGGDELNGGGGDDLVNGGDGDDWMRWNPGDGNDTLNGDAGNDMMDFRGSDVNELITITAAAPRILFTRNVGSVTMDIGTTESVDFSGLGGADTVNVGPNLTPLGTVVLILGAGNDVVNTVASSKVVANGQEDFDTVNFNALNQPMQATATSITVGGVLVFDSAQFESVVYQNALGGIPTVTIESPTTNQTMTATTPFISLSGTAADDAAVTSVTWVNSSGGSGTAVGTTSWSIENVGLRAGINTITVSTTDAQGNTGSDVLTVTVNALTYTMAEGATGPFFDTDILIANPNNVQAPVEILYLKGDGTTVPQTLTLEPMTRTTIEVDGIAGLEGTEVSATVTSTNALPLVVERTMRWDDSNYGAHTEKATDGPALKWFFAEGSQGFFQTYVLLANPGAAANEATVRFLRENEAPVELKFPLDPTSRRTIFAGDFPELVDRSFGIEVTFQNPGVAERAMYFGFTPLFNAGHESAGVTSPAREWFLAEGATGSFFTTFVLLANPGTSDATATLTFLPDTGVAVTASKEVPAGGRVTVNVAAEDASLGNSAVATQVSSTQPILVERAQYWPRTPAEWYEAHNSFGATSVGTRWGLAEGRVGGPQGYQTYILLANANDTAAEVEIRYLKTNADPILKTYTVQPKSRRNVHVNELVPELANESFGALIDVISGPGIFVERALYSDITGLSFAAGTNALATRLP